MARLERDFASAGEAALSNREFDELLAGCPPMSFRQRQQAIACYLSASEGWDEAMKALRGAFASDAAAVRPGNAGDKREINQRASEYLQSQAVKPAGPTMIRQV